MGDESIESGAYEAIPIAESWGEDGWRAGVLLSGEDVRGHGAKSLGAQLFSSREEALTFAQSEYGSLGR